MRSQNPAISDNPMNHLAGMRALNDCYAMQRDHEEPLSQKRLKAFAFFRHVQGYSLAKAQRAVNALHPLPTD